MHVSLYNYEYEVVMCLEVGLKSFEIHLRFELKLGYFFLLFSKAKIKISAENNLETKFNMFVLSANFI